jgi:hypothetical protein
MSCCSFNAWAVQSSNATSLLTLLVLTDCEVEHFAGEDEQPLADIAWEG